MRPDSAAPGPLPLAIGVLSLLVPVMAALDIVTPLVFAGLATVYVFLWSRRPRFYWPVALALLGFAAFWVFVANLLYTRDEGGTRVWLLYREFPAANVERALILGIRSWSLSVISLASWMTIPPDELVDALMQQAGMPLRWGYALWTALNALPHFAEIERHTRTVQRYRSGRTRRAFWPAALAVMAAMVRYADRAALVMAERGLERARLPRSWYIPKPWRGTDTLAVLMFLILSGVTWWLLVHFGVFRFGLYL